MNILSLVNRLSAVKRLVYSKGRMSAFVNGHPLSSNGISRHLRDEYRRGVMHTDISVLSPVFPRCTVRPFEIAVLPLPVITYLTMSRQLE